MTPKKAITIVLLLFLIMAAVFGLLYLKKQSAGLDNTPINRGTEAGQNSSADTINEGQPLTPAEATQEKIDKIIEEAKNNPEQNTPNQVRQEIISTINAEIIKQEQNKTPEQKAADLKAQEERQKIIDQINQQIKEQNKLPADQ